MRISDWSSDVCSSDLGGLYGYAAMRVVQGKLDARETERQAVAQGNQLGAAFGRQHAGHAGGVEHFALAVFLRGQQPVGLRAHAHAALRAGATLRDRKSVVWGKSGSVRVHLGGRRSLKKN